MVANCFFLSTNYQVGSAPKAILSAKISLWAVLGQNVKISHEGKTTSSGFYFPFTSFFIFLPFWFLPSF